MNLQMWQQQLSHHFLYYLLINTILLILIQNWLSSLIGCDRTHLHQKWGQFNFRIGIDDQFKKMELELRNFELELKKFELELRNFELELRNFELELKFPKKILNPQINLSFLPH